MNAFTNITPPPSLLRPNHRRRHSPSFSVIRASSSANQPLEEINSSNSTTRRRTALTSFLVTTLASIGVQTTSGAAASALAPEKWGTRSFIREKYFSPGLSPEDAVARIKQTAEGLRSIREMLEHMSWRYVIFYIRLKQSYLDQDLKNAINTLPESRREEYVRTANELVDNMAELDYYVRTPKVYESYLYYEKTLKSIDDVVALLA